MVQQDVHTGTSHARAMALKQRLSAEMSICHLPLAPRVTKGEEKGISGVTVSGVVCQTSPTRGLLSANYKLTGSFSLSEMDCKAVISKALTKPI